MPNSIAAPTTEFAADVLEGLTAKQKYLRARYFYDALGSSLFEAITLLPEYGLTRADERVLSAHAAQIAETVGRVSGVAELGSGSGRKTKHILRALKANQQPLIYRPIDVSSAALEGCEADLRSLAEVQPICADWMAGLKQAAVDRASSDPLLLLFLGSSIGNLEREDIPGFLSAVTARLRPGDFFLLGVDLIKDVDTMVGAYDDATGVTAAFNLNLLGRINRELHADFDLRSFSHEARWNAKHHRIEMHLCSLTNQTVEIADLALRIQFKAGETIWTESSHKFSVPELQELARPAGLTTRELWVDQDWPFAEVLWEVVAR
jgi:L-histidine Nalpha-methyltransferase